jgi:hypothetical protein
MFVEILFKVEFSTLLNRYLIKTLELFKEGHVLP